MNWWFIPPRIVNMGMVDPSDLFGVTQFPQFIPKENPPRKSRGTLQGCDTQWTVWCFLLVYVVSIFFDISTMNIHKLYQVVGVTNLANYEASCGRMVEI